MVHQFTPSSSSLHCSCKKFSIYCKLFVSKTWLKRVHISEMIRKLINAVDSHISHIFLPKLSFEIGGVAYLRTTFHRPICCLVANL